MISIDAYFVRERDVREMQTVSIFMTKYDDILSNFVYLISGLGYTHVAICFDEETQDYYTFNYKGFRREHPFGNKRRYGKSIRFELQVPKEQHTSLKEMIRQMENSQIEWKYSLWGVVLCILGIRYKFKGSYFCSQFVAELLEKSGIIKWKKHPSLYLPNQMCRELSSHIGLKSMTLFQSIEKVPVIEEQEISRIEMKEDDNQKIKIE